METHKQQALYNSAAAVALAWSPAFVPTTTTAAQQQPQQQPPSRLCSALAVAVRSGGIALWLVRSPTTQVGTGVGTRLGTVGTLEPPRLSGVFRSPGAGRQARTQALAWVPTCLRPAPSAAANSHSGNSGGGGASGGPMAAQAAALGVREPTLPAALAAGTAEGGVVLFLLVEEARYAPLFPRLCPALGAFFFFCAQLFPAPFPAFSLLPLPRPNPNQEQPDTAAGAAAAAASASSASAAAEPRLSLRASVELASPDRRPVQLVAAAATADCSRIRVGADTYAARISAHTHPLHRG